MTRKHFVAIAEAISKIANLKERKATAQKMARVCKKQNKLFDRKRFYAACGV